MEDFIGYVKIGSDMTTSPIAMAGKMDWNDGSDNVIGSVWSVPVNSDGVPVTTLTDDENEKILAELTLMGTTSEILHSNEDLDAFMARHGFERCC